MKVLVFTQGDTPESRSAKELGARLETEKYQVVYLDVEAAESEQQAEIYDIYSYPSFVAVQDDGAEIECWRGVIPLESDIKYFLTQ